ncbi:TetR/AcrR family transcriptional regulator [Yinghuangia aomiensis]|uniref:TetR/AcrR family transcriptional regulator n=1 Tax=Yinghuangia aomiensis TaxID=676205 RepID=A0ABP9HFC1_9ACTN
MSRRDAPTADRPSRPAAEPTASGPDAKAPRPVTRGRVEKRQAILDAALVVFAREGYDRAGVDVIAAEAGVAKPTVYNHFGGKETLFREMVLSSAIRSRESSLAAIDALPVAPADLTAELLGLAHRLAVCFRDPRAWVLQRVLVTESAHFPDLLKEVVGDGTSRITEALAGRLALLGAAGRLDMPDPVRAAAHFFALTTGEVLTRSLNGARPTEAAELDAILAAGVDTFLRAFAADRCGG